MFDVIFAYFCFVPWVNHHENHHLGEHISTFSKHLKQIHAHMFFKFVLPQMLSVGFFFNVQSRANFQEKTWAARNPTSTPTIKKNYFIVSFRGLLVFKRLVTEYIPRCFLCLDYIYLHEFGETWLAT